MNRTQPSHSARDRAARPRRRHVLAINNDPDILVLLRDVLEEEGYRVTTQTYAERDLAALRALGPDLIVLDYMWPGEDNGWAMLQVLRMDPATAALPIVLCTGAVREVEALAPQLRALGIRVVLKPFDIDHLVAVVAEALAAPDAPSGG